MGGPERGVRVPFDDWTFVGSVVAGAARVCDADGNGTLNLDDIDGFVAGFLGQTAAGDCTGDGVWNFDDIDCFVACFLGGCG